MAATAHGSGKPHKAAKAFQAPRRLWLALACALLQAGTGQALAAAQPSGSLNPAPTIDRDRIDRQDPVIPRAPRPDVAPRPANAPAKVEESAASGVRGITLAKVRYDGSSLPRAALDAAVAPYIGRELTRETLQAIIDAISGVYTRGNVAFYSVSVPRQVVTGGELAVKIVEGRVSEYALRNQTRSTPTGLIAANMDRLMRDAPTQKSQLERTLSLLRDIPGQTVDAQLRTTVVPGNIGMDLDVRRKQVDIALNLNNNGVTNVVSGVQAQLSVAVHGVLREGDSTRVSGYLPINPSRYQLYTLSHSTPIGSNGTMLAASGAYVRTLTRDNVRGEAKQAGISLSHPLIRSYRRNLSLAVSLDGIDSDNYFLDTAFGGFRSRVARASTTWSSIGAKSGYAVAGTFSQGLSALGARPFVGYSEASFAKANLQATAVTELTKNVAIKVTARAQYSRDRLPTTERFLLGGEGAGMAFRLGIITAERGVAGSAELSWKLKAGNARSGRGGVTAFAYVDGAAAHAVARPAFNLPAQDFSLASAGLGARISPFGGWAASAHIALPVKRSSGNFGNKARFFFSVGRSV
jgi:hemolysin activation/secretion protein